jgi:hypothetical protein
MVERLWDDEILSVLPHATGYERECLIGGLAQSEGATGVVALEGL